MRSEQLKNFVALAELEHMTNAAATVHISEPALSKSLASLENELGVNLFDRHGRNIYLNQYGEVFLPFARQAIEIIESGVTTVKTLKKEHDGEIILRTPPASMFPGLLSSITKSEPNAVIMTANIKEYEMEIELMSGATDLCLTSKKLTNPNLDEYLVRTDDIVLVISKKHPRYDSIDDLDFETLRSFSYVTGRENSMLRRTFMQVFGACDELPKISYTVGEGIIEALEFVTEGLCVALTMITPLDNVPPKYRGYYEVVPLRFLDEDTRTNKYRLYWNTRTVNSRMQQLIKTIKRYFQHHNM